MQYYDVITDPRWRTAANTNIVISTRNISITKNSDCDEIWYTE